MRIGIDARFYSESGIGRYLRNLISHLKILDQKNQYFIFLLPADFKEFAQTENFYKIIADFTWYGFAEQFKLPGLLNKYQLDLVHFPHFNVPIFYSGKFVVTIHDLIHQHHSMSRVTTLDPLTYKIKQFGYRKVFKAAIKNSKHILVPSKFVKRGLEQEWYVNPNKISVIYEAVDDNILKSTQNSKLKTQNLLKKFNIRKPYIFYVGNAHPHKNLEGLIKVFLVLKNQFKNLQLVLSGSDHYFWQRIKKEYQMKGIIYTGAVSDEALVVLYKNAKCFVLPSFEEGFGIPLLEAMACECPVVCSNAGSLREVGGDAAIYFDPKDRTDMTNKTNRILESEKIRQDLIKKGKSRVKLFSWEKLARKTLEVYEACG